MSLGVGNAFRTEIEAWHNSARMDFFAHKDKTPIGFTMIEGAFGKQRLTINYYPKAIETLVGLSADGKADVKTLTISLPKIGNEITGLPTKLAYIIRDRELSPSGTAILTSMIATSLAELPQRTPLLSMDAGAISRMKELTEKGAPVFSTLDAIGGYLISPLSQRLQPLDISNYLRSTYPDTGRSR